MHTSVRLLKNAGAEENREAWYRLADVYEPLIHKWLRQLGIAEANVDDIAQEVLLGVARDLSNFEHNGRTGAFRTWLRRLTANRCRRFWFEQEKSPATGGSPDIEQLLTELTDPASELSHQWDREHDQFVVEHLLRKVQPQLAPEAMEAFRRVALNEEPVADVAKSLGVSSGQIYKFRFRVMRKLEQEAAQLSLSIGVNEQDASESNREHALQDSDA